MEVKGDLVAKRAIRAGRRVDEGLKDHGLLAGNIVLTTNTADWQSADPNGADRDFTLPNATVLPAEGWEVTVHHYGTANELVIKDSGGNILCNVEPEQAAKIKLIDNGTANGIWFCLTLQGNGAFSNLITFSYADNGKPFLESSTPSYAELGSYIWPGSNKVGFPEKVKFLVKTTGPVDIRITRESDGAIIAETLNVDYPVKTIHDMGVISNVTTPEGIWNIETRKNGGGGGNAKIQLYSLQVEL